jgi:hypothetical protein
LPITVNLTLSDEEERQLAGILECNVEGLERALEPYARAALQEYVRMFLGQKVFTRGSDILEYRLFLLIREAFNNELPEEQRICDLLQATTTNSRSLIRSVMSKYQYELQEAISSTLCQTIERAREEGDDRVVTVNSENVIEALNRVVGTIDGSLPPITKKRGSVASYVLKPSCYEQLCLRFGISPTDTNGCN